MILPFQPDKSGLDHVAQQLQSRAGKPRSHVVKNQTLWEKWQANTFLYASLCKIRPCGRPGGQPISVVGGHKGRSLQMLNIILDTA